MFCSPNTVSCNCHYATLPISNFRLVKDLAIFAGAEGLEPTTHGLDLTGGVEPPLSTPRVVLHLNYIRLVRFGEPFRIQSVALTS